MISEQERVECAALCEEILSKEFCSHGAAAKVVGYCIKYEGALALGDLKNFAAPAPGEIEPVAMLLPGGATLFFHAQPAIRAPWVIAISNNSLFDVTTFEALTARGRTLPKAMNVYMSPNHYDHMIRSLNASAASVKRPC